MYVETLICWVNFLEQPVICTFVDTAQTALLADFRTLAVGQIVPSWPCLRAHMLACCGLHDNTFGWLCLER